MRVFIVEDDPLVAEGIAACVTLCGYEVVGIAYTGRESVKALKSSAVNVALIDINLPDITGIEVAREIEKDVLVPCIFLTAYSDSNLIKRLISLNNVYGYLIKPATDAEIRVAIELAVKRHTEKITLKTSLIKSRKSLEDRKIVERAKGLLMDKLQMKECDAMKFLQRQSNEKNQKLVDAAKDVMAFLEK